MTDEEFIKKWGEGADHPQFDDEERKRIFGKNWDHDASDVFWIRSFNKHKEFTVELAQDYLNLNIPDRGSMARDRALDIIQEYAESLMKVQ